MTTEIILVGVGAIMILTAVLGGGLEIKELKIPQVGPGPRIGAGVVGAALLGLGIGVRPPSAPADAPVQVDAASVIAPMEPAVDESGSNPYVDVVYEQLELARQRLAPEGYEMVGSSAGALAADEAEDFSIFFDEGYEYKVVGVCDQDCTDLDLALFDEYDEPVASDVLDDDLPVLDVIGEYGEYWISAHMYECQRAPCVFGIAVFRR
jgi:hypothetical protein